MEFVSIAYDDLVDVKELVAACLRYFHAKDLQEAQVAFTAVRPSPLTMDLDRMQTRLSGYLGDYLLARHEAELEEGDPEDEEDLAGRPNDDERVSEEFGQEPEALSDSPLGQFKAPRQPGRRLTPEELAGEE